MFLQKSWSLRTLDIVFTYIFAIFVTVSVGCFVHADYERSDTGHGQVHVWGYKRGWKNREELQS